MPGISPRTWPLGRLAIAFLAFAWLVGIGVAAADGRHGVDSGRTALAILEARQQESSAIVTLVVECADDVVVEVGEDAGGSDLVQVTVWGRPKVGICHPKVNFASLALVYNAQQRPGAPVDKFVDGATSQVVDLEHDAVDGEDR